MKIQRRKKKNTRFKVFRQTGSHYAHMKSVIDRPVCLVGLLGQNH